MNLVLSGPAHPQLLATVERLSRTSALVPVRQSVWRLDEVDDSHSTRLEVAAYCDSAAVDHAYMKSDLRLSDFKLLALDMDSTLITIECIDELADFAGKRSEVAAITEATMRGDIADFTTSLRQRVALLRGLPVEVLQRVYDERLRLSPGAKTLIDVARANGIYLLLVSGGFTYFADRLARSLGFDIAFANNLETSEGKLTGGLQGTIVDAAFKATQVRRAMRLLRCTVAEAIVVGDGANDIEMMKCVDHSVAYHAKPAVQEQATMSINFGSLTTLLNYFLET